MDEVLRCAGCGTRMYRVTADKRRGWVRLAARGRCSTCARLDVPKDAPDRLCEGGCGFALFQSDQRPVKGQRRHLRGGMCYPCYHRAMKAPLDDAKALALVPELSEMMKAREARKAKQERAEKARAIEYARYLYYKKTRQPA